MLQPVSLSQAAVPDVVNGGGQWVCTGTWDLAICHLFNNISPDEYVQGKQFESSERKSRWLKKEGGRREREQ